MKIKRAKNSFGQRQYKHLETNTSKEHFKESLFDSTW